MATAQKQPTMALAIPEKLSVMPKIASVDTAIGKVLSRLTLEKFNILRAQYAPNTTTDEFALYLDICAARNLNPFASQVYCIVRGTGNRRKATMQVSIDGLRSKAQERGKYAGSDLPEYGPMVEPDKTKAINDVRHPDYVKVTTYSFVNGQRVPHPAIAFWDEYAPLTEVWENNAPTGKYKLGEMWARMPRHMLAKCAEAASIRKGNAETSGLYIAEEMHQADADITPNRIVELDDPNIVDGTVSEVPPDDGLAPPTEDFDFRTPDDKRQQDADVIQFFERYHIPADEIEGYTKAMLTIRSAVITSEDLYAEIAQGWGKNLIGIFMFHLKKHAGRKLESSEILQAIADAGFPNKQEDNICAAFIQHMPAILDQLEIKG